MRLKYEKVIHHAIVNNLFGFGYTKKSCNAQGSSKYYLFVTAPLFLLCIKAKKMGITMSDAHFGYDLSSIYFLILDTFTYFA